LFDWTVERERLARALSDPAGGEQGSSSPTRDGALAVDARYRALVRNLPDTVVAVHDRDLRGVSIDGPTVGRVGFDPAHFEGVPLERLLGAEDYERLGPIFHAALAGETVTTEFEYTPSGAIYSVEVVPLRD
jgi:PAS domain-containing protein